MPRDSQSPCARDGRDTAELVRVALNADDERTAWEAVAVLHYRGSAVELAAARELATNGDPKRRGLAATILGQLGWEDRTFLAESVELLIALLADPDSTVQADAATALGHRRVPKPIPHLLALVAHGVALVRLGVVHGLSCQDDAAAVGGLIVLSTDVDRDVRDWATFGLGSLTGFDSPALREALVARTSEEDAEVRGEALLGLARRRDGRALELVRAELECTFSGAWSIEAAELLADPSLYPPLERIRDALDPENRAYFAAAFSAAMDACRPPS